MEDKFLDFLRKNGAEISPKIRLTTFLEDGEGRRILATEPIQKGELLFTVPRSIMLNPINSKVGPAVRKNKKLTGWTPTILCMMYELVQGPKSFWAPYFEMLPKSVNLPVTWDETECQELLKHSPLAKLVGHENVRNSYHKEVMKCIRDNHTVFGHPDKYPFELFLRAGSLVGAYSFQVETGVEKDPMKEDEDDENPQSMVPMADMLNHRAGCNNARIFDDDSKALRMIAVRDIAAGEECFNTYGTLPNSQLLRQYGMTNALPAQLRRDAAGIPDDLLLEWAEQRKGTNGFGVRQKMAEATRLLEGGLEVTCRSLAAQGDGINSVPTPVRPSRELLSLFFLLTGSSEAVKKASAEASERMPKVPKGRALRRYLDADEGYGKAKSEATADLLQNGGGSDSPLASPVRKAAKAADDEDEVVDRSKRAKIVHEQDSDDEEEGIEVAVAEGEEEKEVELEGNFDDEDGDDEDLEGNFPVAVRKGVRKYILEFLDFYLAKFEEAHGERVIRADISTEPPIDEKMTGFLCRKWMSAVAIKSEWRLLEGLRRTMRDESLFVEI